MTRKLSEFEKQLCLNCENRDKNIIDRVFCIYPRECPKIKNINKILESDRNITLSEAVKAVEK